MVGVGPDDAAIRNVGGGVIVLGRRKPLRILGDRRNDVFKYGIMFGSKSTYGYDNEG